MPEPRFSDPLIREAPVLRVDDTVGAAVRALVAAGLPALPVAGPDGRLCGMFGEREVLAALFPGYLNQLSSASFVPRSLEPMLEKRRGCRLELVRRHLNTEHVEVESEFSDAHVAETFLHHDVLVLPVVDEQRGILGVITRSDFLRALDDRFLGER